jgi:acetylornithine/N-succinyldiaminopimelate aminotransferase
MTVSGLPKSLIAEELTQDPRVAQAKKMLLAAVKEHQSKLTQILPPDPNRRLRYEEMLAEFAELRGSKLWFPYLGSGIGNGAFVELLDGSVKYDFITGIGAHYLGHSHAEFISSSLDASISNTVMQGNLQQNGDSVLLSRLLAHASGMDHCFLTTSGAMANENGLKIAFQKHFPAQRILAFDHAFAGRTLALSQVTDKPAYREGLPTAVAVDYVPFFDPARPEESTREALAILRQHLSRHPKQHALMVFELVQGEHGFYPGNKEFFIALMTLLKEQHIAILADEVQTFGRTSRLFAFQHFELEPLVDIVTIGKLSQVCATLFRKEYRPRPGLLSQTFTGSTSAIHAGKILVEALLKENYYGEQGKNMQIFRHFSANLQKIAMRHPTYLKGPFGIGSMIVFTPFDGSSEKATQVAHALFDAGVLSFIAGGAPTRVRFLVPAGAVTSADIDTVSSILEEVLKKIAAG